MFNYRAERQRYRYYYLNVRRFYQRPATKVSLFVLLSFAFVIFLSTFAIKPTVTMIGQLIGEIEEKRKINDALEEKLSALDNLQDVIHNNQEDINLISSVLPQEFDLGRLTQELEYTAQQNEVILFSTQFQQPVKGEINFSLTALGTFEKLNQYLQTLEQLDRILVLKTVNFISEEDQSQQGYAVAVEVLGQAFYLPESTTETTEATENNLMEESLNEEI